MKNKFKYMIVLLTILSVEFFFENLAISSEKISSKTASTPEKHSDCLKELVQFDPNLELLYSKDQSPILISHAGNRIKVYTKYGSNDLGESGMACFTSKKENFNTEVIRLIKKMESETEKERDPLKLSEVQNRNSEIIQTCINENNPEIRKILLDEGLMAQNDFKTVLFHKANKTDKALK
ncbi:MAG: hypothetical protein ABL927_09205, partial [Bdellovibrionales bacterium]